MQLKAAIRKTRSSSFHINDIEAVAQFGKAKLSARGEFSSDVCMMRVDGKLTSTQKRRACLQLIGDLVAGPNTLRLSQGIDCSV